MDNERSSNTRTEPGERAVAVCVEQAALSDRICDALVAGGSSILTRDARPEDLAGLGNGRRPACVVIALDDLDGPGTGDLRRLCASLGETATVLICSRARGVEVRRALELGVDGVLLEPQIEEALAAVVEVVCVGQVSVPSQRRTGVTVRALTTREKQILAFVVLGLTNTEIASKLYLAESTVKSHLSSAFSKLGVSSRYEAATLVLDPERGRTLGVREVETSQLMQGITG